MAEGLPPSSRTEPTEQAKEPHRSNKADKPGQDEDGGVRQRRMQMQRCVAVHLEEIAQVVEHSNPLMLRQASVIATTASQDLIHLINGVVPRHPTPQIGVLAVPLVRIEVANLVE